MSRFANFNDSDNFLEPAPEDTADVSIQWKGTDACLDFYCTCGHQNHFDGYFAYVLTCPSCGVKWELPIGLNVRKSERPDEYGCVIGRNDEGWHLDAEGRDAYERAVPSDTPV